MSNYPRDAPKGMQMPVWSAVEERRVCEKWVHRGPLSRKRNAEIGIDRNPPFECVSSLPHPASHLQQSGPVDVEASTSNRNEVRRTKRCKVSSNKRPERDDKVILASSLYA